MRVKSRAEPATDWTQVLVASLVLCLGAAVYVLDRPVGAVPFFDAVNLSPWVPPLLGEVGESLPTFAHVFAFSVLTAGWLGGGERVGFWACLTWFGVDIAFELGQHPTISEALAQVAPEWLEVVPFLTRARSYFASGTFDAWDLASIVGGAAAAYLLILATAPRGGSHG